jgi:eukaryotic-like serine/threonine-protein kinase
MNHSPLSRTLRPGRSPVKPGDIIAGKYQVNRILGAGGMGVVLAATHMQLRHAVALKILAPRSASCQLAVPRFVQEARAAARIQNEHVVRVFDVGTLPDGPPYIAMEYLTGLDLRRSVGERGPLPLTEALECLLQACEGIGEAHAVGVIHRDLKPANLVRCERAGAPPLVKVVDFGISKLLPVGAPLHDLVVTAPHEILGSPLYAAPEQLRAARDVDARADIWALGAVAYFMLAGKPPFEADTFAELCSRIAQSRAALLSLLRPDVPRALSSVIDRCLSKDPAERFSTVAELAAALAPFAPPRALLSIERIASLPGEPLVSPLPDRADDTCVDHTLAGGHASGALRWAVGGSFLALMTAVVALTSLGTDRVASARTPRVPPQASASLEASAREVAPIASLVPRSPAPPAAAESSSAENTRPKPVRANDDVDATSASTLTSSVQSRAAEWSP